MRTHKTAARRRGISLAEVAVALAVIMIVSAATATFLVRAINAEAKVVSTMARNEQVENVLECYQWANGDLTAFETALYALGYQENPSVQYEYSLPYTDYIVVATVTVSEDGSTKLSGIQIFDGEVYHYV